MEKRAKKSGAKFCLKNGKKWIKFLNVRKSLRWGICSILCCLILLTVSGCWGGVNTDRDKTANLESMNTEEFIGGDTANTASGSAEEIDTANANTSFDTTKIIYSGNISLNVGEYQSSFDKINNYAVELGGFVQDSGSNYTSSEVDSQANSGYITLRVPSDKFSEAMEQIQTFGSPISSNVSSTNISQQYQDVESQLNNLKIEEERLLEYLKQATNVTDMLTIESELNRVRTEIDSLTTTKKNWDTEMAYSTIYVSLYEKKISSTIVNSPFSELFTKIGEGFITSINMLLVIIAFLIVLIFRLIPFAVIIALGFFVFIKIRKRRKDNKRIEENLDSEKNDSHKDQE